MKALLDLAGGPWVYDVLRVLIGLLLGAIVGSFFATIVTRWPHGKSVLRGRSRCDGCGRVLGPLDLVPLLSWWAARGKCRACGASIDPVHPLIEGGAALICGLCVLLFPLGPALFLTIGGWLLLTLAVLDARHLWLPDALTLSLAALGLTLGDWFLPAEFQSRVIGAVAAAAILFLLSTGYRQLRGREGLGIGDAKLLGAIGAWLGWEPLPLVLLVASGTGLFWALMLRAGGEPLTSETRLPFGTFLCIAVVPAWVIASVLGLTR